MNYSPLDTLQKTAAHLQANLKGHALVSVVLFFALQFVIWFAVCFGYGGMVAGVLATEGNPDAQAGLVFTILALGVPGFLLLLAPFQLVYFSYVRATLAEVDGGEKVSIGDLFSGLLAGLGGMLAIWAALCGVSVVGILLCYVGLLFTAVPVHFAWLMKVDRGLGVGDALGQAWSGFWERPGDHLLARFTGICVVMVLSYIPLVGALAAWPVSVVFDVLSYRQLYPKESNDVVAATS